MMIDNYYKFIYVILDELYDSKKSGIYPKLENFGHERFGISESYWKEIMMDLKEEGYIGGFITCPSKTGLLFEEHWLKKIKITMSGVEYLKENSTMGKMRELAQTMRDFLPDISVNINLN